MLELRPNCTRNSFMVWIRDNSSSFKMERKLQKKTCRPSEGDSSAMHDALLYLVQHCDEGYEERALIAICWRWRDRNGIEDRNRLLFDGGKSRTVTLSDCKVQGRHFLFFSLCWKKNVAAVGGHLRLGIPECEIAFSHIRSQVAFGKFAGSRDFRYTSINQLLDLLIMHVASALMYSGAGENEWR